MLTTIKSQEVRKILEERSLSQNRFAKIVGTTSGYISQILTHRRNPSPNMRQRLIKALNQRQRLKGLMEYGFNDLFIHKGR